MTTATTASSWRRMLPGLAISGISLGVVFYVADIREVVHALQRANYGWIALGLALSLVWLAVRSFVWRALLEDKVSFQQSFLTINAGYLLNNILPFRLGEVGRAFLMGRKSGMGFWHVLSTVVIERALDLAVAVGLLFATLPFVVGAHWARASAIVVGGVVAALFTVLYLVAHNRERALAFLEKLSSRWPIVMRTAGKTLAAFISGLVVLTDGSRFVRVLAWMGMNWTVAAIMYLVVLAAYFPSPEILWAVFGLGVAALGIAAPSSPGAIGVFELSLVGALSLFQLDLSLALAFALTVHFFNYLTTGLLGAYALARDGESLAGLFRRLTVREKAGYS